MTRQARSAANRSGSSTTDAPVASGMSNELPRPYEKKSFAVLYTRSAGPIASTCRPYARAGNAARSCRCMTAFGLPVVPLEYCQKHRSSPRVGAASTGPPGATGASASPMLIFAPLSRTMNSSSSGRATVESGTGMAPSFAAPRNAATNAGESRSTIATRSPRATPRSRSERTMPSCSAATSP